jgi:MYXO-CTERM domain-containing protein
MSLKIRGFVALAGIAASALVASAAGYAIDDGTAEDSIGIGASHSGVWLNTFTLTGGDTVINQISIAFGTPNFAAPQLNGQPITILLYSDATGGDLADATLVYSAASTMSAVGTNTFINFAVPNIAVGTNFAAGFLYNEPAAAGSFPMAWDSSAPTLAGRSWAGFVTPSAPGINPANLGAIPAGQRGFIEALAPTLAGNWLIRANGAVPTPGAVSVLGLAGLAGLRRRR